MSQPCGCCAGIQVVTPESEVNPPGMSTISYRVGTYATFYETMLARLSTLAAPEGDSSRPLQLLTTRDPSDPAIALLDAWAIVADVLSFYQERIANEGYLGTATERRSLLELARLVNYKLRPGVSASVYLAFTVQAAFSGTIPAGTGAQSMPGSGQTPQFYETSADLAVSDAWNNLQPRLTRPQVITPEHLSNADPASPLTVYFQGLSTNLKKGDGLILVPDGSQPGDRSQVLTVVDALTPQATDQRTQVDLHPVFPTTQAAQPQAISALTSGPRSTVQPRSALSHIAEIVSGPLSVPPSVQPPDSVSLRRTVTQTFEEKSDTAPRILAAFHPAAASMLYKAWAGIKPADLPSTFYAARVKAGIFANTFSGAVSVTETRIRNADSPGITTTTTFTPPVLGDAVGDLVSSDGTKLAVLPLDAVYDQITVGSWVAIDRPPFAKETTRVTTFHQVIAIQTVSRETGAADAPTGFTAKVTQLSLNPEWLNGSDDPNKLGPAMSSTPLLRGTIVYAQTEELPLSEVPVDTDVSGSAIELDGVYDGLESGRWAVVSGERTDIPGTSGVTASELVMIAGVKQETASATDTVHTTLTLANALAYQYDRSTVTVYGNVAEATNGQTVGQVLGNGDASQSFQTFALGQHPLTYTSAATPSGIQSTLTVTVNEIEWEETDDISALGPNDHAYITQTDNSGVTSVIFGNGQNGARVPTGTANVKATYRYGIGSAANVDAQQISQLATHPLGAQSVINPFAASGGGDPDSITQARSNTPIAVKALDRLVSVQDYADFSRSYAGIGKAASVRLSNGRRQLVYVTIAGAEDIPIDLNSDLYRNLVQSLEQFGDPYLPILVGVRKLKLLVIVAGFQVLPAYKFESVEPNVRAALLNTFSFDQRNLGQTAFLSQAISVMQGVQGVAFVNVTVFDSVSQDASADALSALSNTLALRRHIIAKPAYVDSSLKLPSNPTVQDLFQIRPAELVYLTPDIPDTLILTEITATNPGPTPKTPSIHRARRKR